jgi:hypothetical protein
VIRTLRFLRAYRAPATATREEEVLLPEMEGAPMTVFGSGPRRWVVLHGITATGRHHPSLLRFARSLAATGCEVVVPEVPVWRGLSIDPAPTVPVVGAAIRAAEARSGPAPTGLVGFSFGATQAVRALGDPALASRLQAVIGFGGYADLDRVAHFSFTGAHDWEGARHRLAPDPYGRWVLAATYLEHTPGYPAAAEVAGAIRELAREAGTRGVDADDPGLAERRAQLGRGLPAEGRDLWRVLVEDAAAAGEEGRALAAALATASVRVHPEMDPRKDVAGVGGAITLAHGVTDRLVPFTEGLRLHRALGRPDLPPVTLTRLLGHSRHEARLGAGAYLSESMRFARLLHRALRSLG